MSHKLLDDFIIFQMVQFDTEENGDPKVQEIDEVS